jgi:hypothetical protein
MSMTLSRVAQVLKMYGKIDPKDKTHWKEHEKDLKKPSKRAQLKTISKLKTMIEGRLSTTKSQDSAAAQKMRGELKKLLAKRAALQASINKQENKVLAKGGFPWAGKVKPDPAATEDTIDILARGEDAKSTYVKWIKAQEHGTAATAHAR